MRKTWCKTSFDDVIKEFLMTSLPVSVFDFWFDVMWRHVSSAKGLGPDCACAFDFRCLWFDFRLEDWARVYTCVVGVLRLSLGCLGHVSALDQPAANLKSRRRHRVEVKRLGWGLGSSLRKPCRRSAPVPWPLGSRERSRPIKDRDEVESPTWSREPDMKSRTRHEVEAKRPGSADSTTS